jgi:hypothetical protein
MLTLIEKAIHGETALHVAFASDKADCVRYLLTSGARMDLSDRCVTNHDIVQLHRHIFNAGSKFCRRTSPGLP